MLQRNFAAPLVFLCPWFWLRELNDAFLHFCVLALSTEQPVLTLISARLHNSHALSRPVDSQPDRESVPERRLSKRGSRLAREPNQKTTQQLQIMWRVSWVTYNWPAWHWRGRMSESAVALTDNNMLLDNVSGVGSSPKREDALRSEFVRICVRWHTLRLPGSLIGSGGGWRGGPRTTPTSSTSWGY